jgi:hypothetical protein
MKNWRARLPAGEKGRSNYEGNLIPGADRQAILGQIMRFLVAKKAPFFVTS